MELIECTDCKYCDENETNGEKVYCEWYKTYEYPSEAVGCSHYREK